MSKKLLLIDGNSIVNRAFYGVPPLTNRAGLHTNAIYGFLNIILKVLDEENPTHLLVAFDKKAPTFRHKMFKEYKGTRKPMPGELAEQMPVLKEVLKAMNIVIYSEEGIEADDILGTMAKRGEKDGLKVVVLSGDRDLLQLATDKILVRVPKTKGGKTTVENYYSKQVIEKYFVTPSQIVDLKGLMGDSSDNIPGVPGVGEKTATKILAAYGTVENAIEHVEEITPNRAKEAIKNNIELARLSKELATIKTDCKISLKMDDLLINDMFNQEAYSQIKSLEIKSLLKRFDANNQTIDFNLEKKFFVVDSKDKLVNALEKYEAKQPLSVKVLYRDDTSVKTDSDGQLTLFMQESVPKIIGAAISYSSDNTFFAKVNDRLTSSELIDEIERRIIEAKGVLVTNDLKNQLDFFEKINKYNSFDTNIAAYILNPNQKGFTEEEIAEFYAETNMPEYASVFGKMSYEQAFEEKENDLATYACYQAYVNFKSYEPLATELKKTKQYKLYKDIEHPLIFTLYNIEKRGILVKKEALKTYGENLGEQINALEKDIYALAGEEFNINSPKQLGVILFEKMHLPYGKKTKTGYSTSAEVLEKLRVEDPIVEKILEYRQLTKLKSTYADGLDNYIDEDGRIRTTFNQNITATGRLSSTEPNLQNIPIRMEQGRQIRKVFVPKDGCVFLDADYSQIELRVLAHMSDDEKLIESYKKDADIHRSTAALVFNTPYDEVTDLQRRNAKAVNFGIVYGISSFGLSKDLDITVKEATKYIEDYFETYPKVKAYMDSMVEKGKKKGFVSSLYGRRRPIPELAAKNFMQRQFGERIAMNSPIQGTAADIIKIAMNRVEDKLTKGGYKSQLILQIHDELLIETYIDEIEEVKKILEEEMVNACELSVPLIAEVVEGDNWYEAK